MSAPGAEPDPLNAAEVHAHLTEAILDTRRRLREPLADLVASALRTAHRATGALSLRPQVVIGSGTPTHERITEALAITRALQELPLLADAPPRRAAWTVPGGVLVASASATPRLLADQAATQILRNTADTPAPDNAAHEFAATALRTLAHAGLLSPDDTVLVHDIADRLEASTPQS